jgi:hypothetical protein
MAKQFGIICIIVIIVAKNKEYQIFTQNLRRVMVKWDGLHLLIDGRDEDGKRTAHGSAIFDGYPCYNG